VTESHAIGAGEATRRISPATSRLIFDLVRDARLLAATEAALAEAEVGECVRSASSGIGKVAASLILLSARGGLLLAALCFSLRRFGLPLDAACLAVATASIIVGWLLMTLGGRALQPSKLVPKRSLAQFSSLLWRA
jgi:tetrahydromethanopterin S-methyltransferase subunit C